MLTVKFNPQMKPILAVFATPFAIAACLELAQADPIIFNAQTPGLAFTGNPSFNAAGYDPAAIPNVDPNVIYVYTDGSATASMVLPAGRYFVSSRRTVTDTGGTAFNVTLGGVNVTRDYAIAGPGQANTFQEAAYLGYYISNGTATVGINSGSTSVARLNYLSFTQTGDVFFDENTAGLSFAGPGTGTFAATTPAGFTNTLLNSVSVNAIGIASGVSGGSLSGSISLVSGQTYEVFVSRQLALNSEGTSFDLSLGGDYFATVSGSTSDPALNDTFGEISLGFYTPGTSSVPVLIDEAGNSYGRLDFVRFAAVPEPASLGLAAFGLMLGSVIFRKKIGDIMQK